MDERESETSVRYAVSAVHGIYGRMEFSDPKEAAKAFHEINAGDRPSVIRVRHGTAFSPGGSGQVIATTAGKAEAGQAMEYWKYSGNQDPAFDAAYRELAFPAQVGRVTDAVPLALEPIHRNGYTQPDRAEVEDVVTRAVEADPRRFIEMYKQDERSFGGRYVAADLFKETFEQYSASKEARNRYNAPVHNSAAVLSAALFRETLADKTHPERDTVIFLTGIPGAGKTSSVQAGTELPQNYRAVFEGQLSNPDTTKAKIQLVLDAGLRPVVIAVHARPESALGNTFKRFEEGGRGASINVMSSIQGGLPDSLREVHERFGDAVELRVYDYRDRLNPAILKGWEHLNVLRSEGNHEQIKQRLSNALEQHRAAGSITEANYRQASGAAPLERGSGMGSAHHAKHEAHGDGRSVPPGSRQETILTPVIKDQSSGVANKDKLPSRER